MELDELKNTWEEVQGQVSKQHSINDKMINKMTQTKYNNRMKRITYPEIMGTIVCFLGAVYMILHFYKLNTIFLQGLGITVVLILLIMPTISLTLLWQFSKTGDVSQPYAETLKSFAVQKIRFYRFQKITALITYILLVAFIILIPCFFGVRTFNNSKYFWLVSIPIGYIFLYVFSKWVLKSYKKTLQQSEELLKELQP